MVFVPKIYQHVRHVPIEIDGWYRMIMNWSWDTCDVTAMVDPTARRKGHCEWVSSPHFFALSSWRSNGKTWCRMFILESQIRHFSADECRYAVLFFDIITWYYLELLTNPESERTKATRYFQTRQKRMEKRDFVQCSAEAERWWDLTCATTLFHRMLKRLHLTVRHFHWNLISWAPSNWNSSKLSQSSDAACHHPTAGAEFLWTATRFCGLGRRSGGDRQQQNTSTYGKWLRNPRNHQKYGWYPMNNGMFTTYQLVQDSSTNNERFQSSR